DCRNPIRQKWGSVSDPARISLPDRFPCRYGLLPKKDEPHRYGEPGEASLRVLPVSLPAVCGLLFL
ncbi:MAG: hypothetical protein AVDCRST_MAG56-6148, partial [uncultured Cytophagales bacterium]